MYLYNKPQRAREIKKESSIESFEQTDIVIPRPPERAKKLMKKLILKIFVLISYNLFTVILYIIHSD